MRPQSTAQPTQMSPSPNQTSGPPELWTPAGQAFQPTNAAPPPDLLARPPVIATPLSQYIPQPIPLQPAIPYTPKRGVSRRTIILGLAGLVVAGGGIAWFSASHGLVSSPANNSSASSSPGGIKAGPGVDLATKTINLGILSPFSGPVAAPIGDPLARGVEVFFKSVNDHGGIDGFKVKPD